MFARASHRTRIVTLVLASGLPVLLLAIFGLWRYLDAAKQEIVDDRVAMAEAASLTTQAFVGDISSSVQTLALSPALADRGRAQALLDGARQANPDWQSIAVLDATGHAVVSSGPAPADTPQLRQLLQQPTSGVSIETQQDNGGRVLISAPLQLSDGSRGTLVVSPSIRVLANELRAQARGTQLDVVVVNSNGALVLAPTRATSKVPQVRSTQPGAVQVDAPGGQMLVAYAPVSSVNWNVLIDQPASVAFAGLEQQVGIAAVAILLALVAAGAMAWVLGGRLSLYYERIVQARDRAEEATATRDAVLASVSHDLQNPIAAAKGYLQLIQRRIAIDPQAPAESLQRALEQTERAVARMQQMTEELVDSARLRAGYELALRPALTDLSSLVQQVVDDQSAAVTSHQIHLGTDAEEVWVACDPARITRVVANVLSNAVKYSPRDSQVVVELRREDDMSGHWALLSVSDEGIGIPEADLPHLFERFHRAGNASSHAAGTGLGLAGVRSIVEQHGGNIAVESLEGVGTTVRIRLPRSVGATSGLERRSA
jgi:signal transduction histidine kinase